jgi:hypothetical protein
MEDIRSSLKILFLAFPFLAAGTTSAFAQGDPWHCALDAGNGVNQTEPPALARLARVQQNFAPQGSNFIADLNKGGPTGVFLYTHLHGIQNDRYGQATYYMTVLVEDEGGYVYWATPPLVESVHGVGDKPSRHVHCAGQWLPDSPELRQALARGVKLQLAFIGGRNRTDVWGDIAPSIQNFFADYFGKKLGLGDLLAKLNVGKSPK